MNVSINRAEIWVLEQVKKKKRQLNLKLKRLQRQQSFLVNRITCIINKYIIKKLIYDANLRKKDYLN